MCEHENTKKSKFTKVLGGHTFSSAATMCSDCGAILHSQEIQNSYMAWLGDLYSDANAKELFTIQPMFTAQALEQIDGFAARYPTLGRSDVIRILVTVYNEKVAPFPMLREAVNDLSEKKIYAGLFDGSRKRASVRFRPASFERITGLSEALECPPAKIVESAVLGMLVVLKYWELSEKHHQSDSIDELEDLPEQVDLMLKAA